ncbi:MAG: SH3 domain-containing protein [Chloroflexi bacterium]|nr:SH3 domain-containing protein [Chloroflexota bacterium]MBI3168464.1 SH3 domain-containing protein [Chloroflexota bacterium]
MTQYKFHPHYLTLTILLIVFGIFFTSFSTDVLAQQPTETPAAVSGLFITVITTEPQINVRMGPSSTVYPVVGVLLTGSTAPALGRSQGGDWIQIEFPSAPGGKGWVYSPLVQVSPPGNLQVVEPPPTPIPPATSTIDPTLAAQFVVQPTTTRLPTFTPAPTLVRIEFEQSANPQSGIPWASIIIALAVLGVIGFLLSLIIRR